MQSRSLSRAAALALLAPVSLSTVRAEAGALLVGDLTNAVIRAYDDTTGAYRGVFTSGGPALVSPWAMTLGPDNNLYVSDVSNSQIKRYNGTTGAYISTFATTTGSPYGLEFGPDHNLYVGVSGGSVKKLDGTTGAPLGTFTTPPNGVDFGGMTFHGNSLFVTYVSGSMYEYNATTGAQVSNVYNSFSGNGPRAPRFGPDGNIYVPDWQTPHVAKFDGNTHVFLGNVVNDNSIYPMAVAFGPDGALDVLNDNSNTDGVRKYDSQTGALLGTLVAPGGGGLGRSAGMVFDANVPEPTSLALVATGAMAILARRRRR